MKFASLVTVLIAGVLYGSPTDAATVTAFFEGGASGWVTWDTSNAELLDDYGNALFATSESGCGYNQFGSCTAGYDLGGGSPVILDYSVTIGSETFTPASFFSWNSTFAPLVSTTRVNVDGDYQSWAAGHFSSQFVLTGDPSGLYTWMSSSLGFELSLVGEGLFSEPFRNLDQPANAPYLNANVRVTRSVSISDCDYVTEYCVARTPPLSPVFVDVYVSDVRFERASEIPVASTPLLILVGATLMLFTRMRRVCPAALSPLSAHQS